MSLETLKIIIGVFSTSGATLLIQKLLTSKKDKLDLIEQLSERLYKEIGRLEEKINILEKRNSEAQLLNHTQTLRINELEEQNRKQAIEIQILKKKLNNYENSHN